MIDLRKGQTDLPTEDIQDKDNVILNLEEPIQEAQLPADKVIKLHRSEFKHSLTGKISRSYQIIFPNKPWWEYSMKASESVIKELVKIFKEAGYAIEATKDLPNETPAASKEKSRHFL